MVLVLFFTETKSKNWPKTFDVPKIFLKVSPVMDIEYIIKVVFSATIIPLNMKWNSLWFANHLVAPLTEQKGNNQIFEKFIHKLLNENQGKVLLIMLV